MRTRLISSSILAFLLVLVGAPTVARSAPTHGDTGVVPLDPGGLEAMDHWVYFSGFADGIGNELWRNDGATTELVIDLNPGPGNSLPRSLKAMSGWLYFIADVPGTGSSLWRTDGADTVEFVADDIYTYGELAVLDGWLYFTADAPGFGAELWRTDGITTELVADIDEGPSGSSILDKEAMGGWLYMNAYTSGLGRELWRTDGDTTELVANISPDLDGSNPRDLESLDGWLYFRAYTEDALGASLWRSDGYSTEMVADIDRDAWPLDLETLDGWVYFNAYAPETGSELWHSNGSTTELVADIDPGPPESNPRFFEAMDGWVYFAAGTAGPGNELWRSNGARTELVADVNPGVADSSPQWFEEMDGWVYFAAEIGGLGRVLWRSDGSTTERLGGELGAEVFSGYVDGTGETGPEWVSTLYAPLASGTHRFTLHWVGSSDVKLAIREASTGRWIGDNTGSDRPKTMTVALEGGVEYRLAVWADFSRAQFTAYVHAPVPGMELFGGSVDADRVTAAKWAKWLYVPPHCGDHTVALTWDGDAALRIAVKEDATKTTVAKDTSDKQPKVLAVQLAAGTTYRVSVWAVDGFADFTVFIDASWGETLFTGTVDADRIAARKWTKALLTPAIGGHHGVTLLWIAEANLRVSVKDRVTGALIAKNVTLEQPKRLTVHLEADTNYQVSVWAKEGTADFAVCLHAP